MRIGELNCKWNCLAKLVCQQFLCGTYYYSIIVTYYYCFLQKLVDSSSYTQYYFKLKARLIRIMIVRTCWSCCLVWTPWCESVTDQKVTETKVRWGCRFCCLLKYFSKVQFMLLIFFFFSPSFWNLFCSVLVHVIVFCLFVIYSLTID